MNKFHAFFFVLYLNLRVVCFKFDNRILKLSYLNFYYIMCDFIIIYKINEFNIKRSRNIFFRNQVKIGRYFFRYLGVFIYKVDYNFFFIFFSVLFFELEFFLFKFRLSKLNRKFVINTLSLSVLDSSPEIIDLKINELIERKKNYCKYYFLKLKSFQFFTFGLSIIEDM